MNAIQRAIEALEAALTWDSQLNNADQLTIQGKNADSIQIRLDVHGEINSARAALAELRRCEVVEGYETGSIHDAASGDYEASMFGVNGDEGDRPALLLLLPEEAP